MRVRHLVILVVVLIASSIIGQEEPLPAVIPNATPPLVALAVEPAIDVPPPTLADAARANDYATFAALYEKTKDAAYAPLHELWTYSVTDPIGAFYGAEMYEKLTRAYPAFAEYIEEYRIVDMRGNVFYPTSETRRFLLARAVEGVRVAVPKVEVARREEREAPPARPAEVVPAGSRRTGRQDAGAPAVAVATAVAAPAPVQVPVQVQVQVAAVVPVAPILAPPPAPPIRQNTLAGRGLLLVIFGLIGIGLLALIMKTPGEPTVINPRRDP